MSNVNDWSMKTRIIFEIRLTTKIWEKGMLKSHVVPKGVIWNKGIKKFLSTFFFCRFEQNEEINL